MIGGPEGNHWQLLQQRSASFARSVASAWQAWISQLNEEMQANRGDRRGPRYMQPPATHQVWGSATQDLLLHIVGYLDARSTATLQATDRCTRATLLRSLKSIWDMHTARDFPVEVTTPSGCGGYAGYLEQLCALKDKKVRNLESLLKEHSNIYKYTRRKGGILGCLSELAYLDDPLVAAAISRRRFMAMNTIAVVDGNTICDFKHATKYSGQATFFPLDAVANCTVDEETQFKLNNPPTWFKGFRGFVLQLLRLEPQHEHLRNTVYYTIFKDMMVFDKMEQLVEYNELTQRENFAIALDFWPTEELDAVYPRLLLRPSEPLPTRSPADNLAAAQRQLEAIRTSMTVVRYTH